MYKLKTIKNKLINVMRLSNEKLINHTINKKYKNFNLNSALNISPALQFLEGSIIARYKFYKSISRQLDKLNIEFFIDKNDYINLTTLAQEKRIEIPLSIPSNNLKINMRSKYLSFDSIILKATPDFFREKGEKIILVMNNIEDKKTVKMKLIFRPDASNTMQLYLEITFKTRHDYDDYRTLPTFENFIDPHPLFNFSFKKKLNHQILDAYADNSDCSLEELFNQEIIKKEFRKINYNIDKRSIDYILKYFDINYKNLIADIFQFKYIDDDNYSREEFTKLIYAIRAKLSKPDKPQFSAFA